MRSSFSLAVALSLSFLLVSTNGARIKQKVSDFSKFARDHQKSSDIFQAAREVKSARLVENPDANTANASKAEFVMPDFDDFARIRDDALVKVHINPTTAKEVVKVFASGYWFHGSLGSSSIWAKRGITSKAWESIMPKLAAWKKYAVKERMKFSEFLKMTKRDPSWKPEVNLKVATPEVASNQTKVAEWLKKNFGYWKYFSGKELAKDFIESGADLQELINFASLSKDLRADMNFEEAYPALPTDENAPELSWSNVALIEKTDFAGLNFPSALTDSVMQLRPQDHEGFTSADWDALDLQGTITAFVARDKRPYELGKSEKVRGKLKFYQIAEILPGDQELDESNNFVETIRGRQIRVHVPTFEDVVGIAGRQDLTSEMIERWLLKEEQGMENNWLFFTDTNHHAKKMARDVLRWGDGSIPGQTRIGFQNGAIQGPVGPHNQFADVAPRLALFLKLDEDHDGLIDFATAHKYLKASAASN